MAILMSGTMSPVVIQTFTKHVIRMPHHLIIVIMMLILMIMFNVIDNIVKNNFDNVDVAGDNIKKKNGESNMDKNDKNNCNSKGNKKGAVKLPCNENCKALTDSETDSIAELKEAFSKAIEEFRNALKNVDSGCTNKHDPQKNGHPLRKIVNAKAHFQY